MKAVVMRPGAGDVDRESVAGRPANRDRRLVGVELARVLSRLETSGAHPVDTVRVMDLEEVSPIQVLEDTPLATLSRQAQVAIVYPVE